MVKKEDFKKEKRNKAKRTPGKRGFPSIYLTDEEVKKLEYFNVRLKELIGDTKLLPLSTQIGVDEKSLRLYTKTATNISLIYARRIAKHFDISIDSLLGD